MSNNAPAWRLLDTHETHKFIEEVRDPAFAALFEGPAYELWALDLPFFDGYAHVQLCNKAMIPYFTLDYISNGENHFYLDGSEHPLELLVQKDALRLSTHNVLDYLQFHSDVTFYPYRKVKFITDPAKAPYSGASAMGHHFKTLKAHAQLEVRESAENSCFYVTMPVLYNGETVQGHVQVMQNGQINILEPVRIPLMDQSRDHVPLDYDHPHEKELIEQNVAVLVQSEEGKRLWETIKSYNIEIRLISAVAHRYFVPNKNTIFIVAPENVQTQSPYQVIDIACALRECELLLMDETRGDAFEDQAEWMSLNMGRNLDILLHMCKIGQELENADLPDVSNCFRKLGMERLYSAHLNGEDIDTMMEIYGDFVDKKLEG